MCPKVAAAPAAPGAVIAAAAVVAAVAVVAAAVELPVRAVKAVDQTVMAHTAVACAENRFAAAAVAPAHDPRAVPVAWVRYAVPSGPGQPQGLRLAASVASGLAGTEHEALQRAWHKQHRLLSDTAFQNAMAMGPPMFIMLNLLGQA